MSRKLYIFIYFLLYTLTCSMSNYLLDSQFLSAGGADVVVFPYDRRSLRSNTLPAFLMFSRIAFSTLDSFPSSSRTR